MGQVLAAALQGDGIQPPALDQLVADRDLRGVVEAARYHRVVSWTYRALREVAGVDPAVVDRLRLLHRASARSHLRVTAALVSTAEALDGAGIRWLVFKGPVLSECVYRLPEMRLYRDLDLLVARQDFGDALRVLQDAGATLLDHNWPLIRRDGYGELNLVERNGTPLDLHWQLLFSQELRSEFPIPVDEVIERSGEVTIRGRQVATMDPTDSLLHLAVHAALGGGDRLIWLKDLQQSIAHREPDWDELISRARAWRVQVPVALMLDRANRAVGADLPEGVVASLMGPRTWRALTSTVDRVFPAPRSRGGGDPATMLARTVRGTASGSFMHMSAVFGRRVVRLATERRWDVPETEDDPTNPESVRYSAGVDGDLDRYLQHVRAKG